MLFPFASISTPMFMFGVEMSAPLLSLFSNSPGPVPTLRHITNPRCSRLTSGIAFSDFNIAFTPICGYGSVSGDGIVDDQSWWWQWPVVLVGEQDIREIGL